MSPETQAPGWEWYFVAMYFFIGGMSAGAYFIGSLVELFGDEHHREISRVAFYIAFPLILITPILLIADLGRPERFWHLFIYNQTGLPYINLQSPLSVGSWALLVYSLFAFLSFLDNLVHDGILRFAPFANAYHLLPRRLYALVGTLAGFFIAGYTGVLLNTTARPLWAATDPLLGVLFVVSAGSTGAAAIALVMGLRRMVSHPGLGSVETFDRISLIVELVLIVVMIVIAGEFAAPLLVGPFALLFWGGVVVLGIVIPLALGLFSVRRGIPVSGLVMLSAILVILGGALLRITMVVAGQV